MRYLEYVHTRHRLARTGCYVCTGGNDVVDFETTILGEGSLGICRKHLRQAARLIGLEDPEAVAQLKSNLEEARATVDRLRRDVGDRDAEITTLRGRVDDLRTRTEVQAAELDKLQRTASELSEQLFAAEEARRDAREGTDDGDSGDDEPGDFDVPRGSVDEVLEWVGDDPERALAAAEVESGRSKPRSTLLDALEAVLGDDGEGE